MPCQNLARNLLIKVMSFLSKIKEKLFNAKFPMVGVDISDNSIELLQLKSGGGIPRIKSSFRQDIEAGLIKNGEIIELEKLAAILKQTFSSAQPRLSSTHCLLSLPDKNTYFLSLQLKINGSSLETKIQSLAQEKLPVDLACCYFNYLLTEVDKQNREVFFAAAEKKTIAQFEELFAKAGLNLAVIEFESASLARALLDDNDSKKPAFIVDLGAVSTDIVLHDEHGFRDQINLPFGGYKLAKTIAETLKLEFGKAEELKKKEGLLLKQDGLGKILSADFNGLFEEIKQIRVNYESRTGNKVEKLILAGGTSLLPGLLELFSQSLPDLKIEKGDPTKKIKFSTEVSNRLLKNDIILYSNVIGLALRGLKRESIDQGINLVINNY